MFMKFNLVDPAQELTFQTTPEIDGKIYEDIQSIQNYLNSSQGDFIHLNDPQVASEYLICKSNITCIDIREN